MVDQYSKSQRNEMANTLAEAKKHLWSGLNPQGNTHRFICHAVEMTGREVGREVRNLIGRRIEPSTSLIGWLMVHGVPSVDLTPLRLQTHRHAWVDLLISELRGQ